VLPFQAEVVVSWRWWWLGAVTVYVCQIL